MSDYYNYDYSGNEGGGGRGANLRPILNIAAAVGGFATLVGFFLPWVSVGGADVNGFWLTIGGGLFSGGLLTCLCLAPLLGLILIISSILALLQNYLRYAAIAQLVIAALLCLPVLLVIFASFGVSGVLAIFQGVNVNGYRPNIGSGVSLGFGFWLMLITLIVSAVAGVLNLREGAGSSDY